MKVDRLRTAIGFGYFIDDDSAGHSRFGFYRLKVMLKRIANSSKAVGMTQSRGEFKVVLFYSVLQVLNG